jgi:hypothetical protein
MGSVERDWHREILALPTALGATLVGFALGSWWYGLPLIALALLPYHHAYVAYFSVSKAHPRRRHLGTNAFFVVAQVALWASVFFAVHALFYGNAAI